MPAEAVTVRLPPTFDAPSTVARLLVRLALPPVPLVLSDAAPVSRLALVSVIVASVAEVVNDDAPVTVSTPVCVRLPSVLTAVRLPRTLEVPSTSPPARSLVRLALPLAPLVVSDTAPVSRLASVSVMVAFAVEVVNEDVPPTVSAPLCVRLPTRSVTVRLPPTFDAPSTVARLLVRLALPLAPLVLSDTAPVSRLPVLVSVMVAFDAEVVNDDVPATVSAPVCVRLPTEPVTVRLPPTFEAPSTVALIVGQAGIAAAPAGGQRRRPGQQVAGVGQRDRGVRSRGGERRGPANAERAGLRQVAERAHHRQLPLTVEVHTRPAAETSA